MIRFLVRRLLYHGVVTMILVTVTVFFVTRLMTDPVLVMLPPTATQQDYLTLQSALGLDRSLLDQFVTFLTDLVRLDFGTSIWAGLPARDLVLERLPATFELVAAGILVAVVVFVPIGIVASLQPGGWLDRILVTVSLLGVSMPQFWFGAMLIFFFALVLGWLPTSGADSPLHLVLPAITIGLTSGGRIAQISRSSMIDQLNMPYVTALRAKGISRPRLIVGHLLRNAAAPIVTLIMFETAYALTGYAVIVETVFAWPGIGRLAVQAITQRDVILLQAIVFITAFLVIITNIIADLMYTVIDPRVRVS